MAKRRKTEKLAVYQNLKHTGTLERSPSGAMFFQYAPSWLADKNAFAISLNLPLQEAEFKGAEVSAYFDNLLPDNLDVRNKVASRVQAESNKTFDLLHAIGHDCIGALQFMEEGSEAPGALKIQAESLSEKEIAAVIKNLGFFPLGMQEEEPEFRLSIAGAQEKTALLKWKGKWHRPLGATPTTHILKPAMGEMHNGIDLTTSVENEYLCLKIFELFGLSVPECEISEFGAEKCLVVERFDRKWLGADKLIRLPQEDFCQALGYFPTKKYESDAGPGIPEMMKVLDASDERDEDRKNFMRSQVLFYLMAATDGHAKNFSLFLSPNGFKLTPFYDVMSIFPAIEKKQIAWQKGKLAMALGDSRHYKLKDISGRHFIETAKKVGMSKTVITEIIEEMKAKVLSGFEDEIKLPKKFPAFIFSSIVKGMKKQAERL